MNYSTVFLLSPVLVSLFAVLNPIKSVQNNGGEVNHMFIPPEQYHSARTGSGAHPGNRNAPAILFLRLACSGHNALSWPEDRFALQYLSVLKSRLIQAL